MKKTPSVILSIIIILLIVSNTSLRRTNENLVHLKQNSEISNKNSAALAKEALLLVFSGVKTEKTPIHFISAFGSNDYENLKNYYNERLEDEANRMTMIKILAGIKSGKIIPSDSLRNDILNMTPSQRESYKITISDVMQLNKTNELNVN